MRLVYVLFRRNLRAFVRDPLTVFFTFLAPGVFIFLFIVFYRKMVSTTLMDTFPSAPEADVVGLVDSWLFASCVLLATYTSTLGMLNAFIMDKETGRFSDYLVSPVKRWQLTLGYISSTWLVATVIATALVLLCPVWALLNGQAAMGPGDLVRAVGATALSTLVFAALNTLIATFLKSWGAFGGFSIVMGVSIGFLGFCYTPPSVLTSAVNTVLGVLPFAQGASLIRAAVMRPSLDRLLTSVSDPAQVGPVDQGIQNALAMTLEVGGWTLPTLFLIGVLAVLAAVLTGLASWRMSHVIK